MLRHRVSGRDERGFTLIELLVVILVIGILAAIALPSFLSQERKAEHADAQSQARNLQTEVESCYVDTKDYAQCDSDAEVPHTGFKWGTNAGQVSVQVKPLGQNVVAYMAVASDNAIYAVVRDLGTKRTSRACLSPNGQYPYGNCKSGGGYPGFGTW